MKVGVVFHRVGPYHFARLQAAGRLSAIVAIETSGVDETYAWDGVVGSDCFKRVTLFDHADAQKLPAAAVVGRIGSALNEVQPAVVLVPGWADTAALGALQWCVQNRVPSVVMSESTAWDEARRAWREAVKQRIVGCFSAALVGGTPHADYITRLGMPRERVFLGYDAVDNSYFARKAEILKAEKLKAEGQEAESGKQKAESRKQETGVRPPSSVLCLPHGLPERYFLASARFIEKKNLPRLIEAYARYRTLCEDHKTTGQWDYETARPRTTGPRDSSEVELSRGPVVSSPVVPWSLVLLGDGPLRPALNSQLSTLNLQHCVHLPGFKQYPDLPTYYGLASAFIHASTTEQWGLVVNEAMASGLPVLVSNRCGCSPDLVQDGVNGFTFDPLDVDQLAQLMLKLSTLNSQLSTMGAASQRIISEWGPERFASGLQQAVETALRVPRPRAGVADRLLLRLLALR